jgi:uncharacterized membrane protein
MNKARVDSFSDSVFAFAITLLVLGFQVPDLKAADDRALLHALVGQLPQLIPYATSFATIGIIWLNHHAMFHEVDQVERSTLVLSLLLLLVVSFIPYPTAVLGRYGPLRSSTVLYGITLTLLGGAYTLLWRHIVRRKLSRVCKEANALQATTRRNLIGTFGYPLGTAVAFASPKTAVVIYLTLAMFYFLPEHRTRIIAGGIQS